MVKQNFLLLSLYKQYFCYLVKYILEYVYILLNLGKRRRESSRFDESGLLEKSNPITNIPNAVLGYLNTGRDRYDSRYQGSASEISIDSVPRDHTNERIYRIFLVWWFLHAIIGLITLLVDFNDKKDNPYSYYLVACMTFKWLVSAILTVVFTFIIFIFWKVFLGHRSFVEYIGAIYMIFSGTTSLIIVLAVPLCFRALYISTNLQFMTLLYLQMEIVLDCTIIAEVAYNIAFSGFSNAPKEYQYDEEERGIKDVLSNRNLERLQKEIFDAYENNDILKFDQERSRREHMSPERTHSQPTDNLDQEEME